jgi:chemotaxis family two-component system response regulator PixH
MEIDTKRIALLVEDLPSLRETVSRYLRDNGLRVEAASDYQSAVAILTTCVPHLICLDVTLPRESGFELCEYIRRDPRLAWVPILVLSERASPEDMAYAEQVGANAYLKKPFTHERFDKYVTTLLDGANASRPSVRRLRRTEPP